MIAAKRNSCIFFLQIYIRSPVEYVVGHGEHPEDAKDEKHLGVEHLVGQILVKKYKKKCKNWFVFFCRESKV